MAEIAKSISVEVKPKLTVDLETAQACMTLVNLFLESNGEYWLARSKDGWRLTTDEEQEHEYRSYFMGRYDGAKTDEERMKWRRLAGLED